MNRIPVPHYCKGEIEFIDAAKAMSTSDEFRGFLRISAMKYLWRYQHKGTPVEDLQKASTYLAWLQEETRPKEQAFCR